jgi:hypothetical protein
MKKESLLREVNQLSNGLTPQGNPDPSRPEKPSFDLKTPIATTSMFPNHVQVFAVNLQGQVNTVYLEGHTVKLQDWTVNIWKQIGNNSVIFPKGTPLSAISRQNGIMEVFGVAADFCIYRAVYIDRHWRNWEPIGNRKVTFSHQTPLAIISRNEHHTEIFGVGKNGHAYGAWFWDGQFKNWFQLGNRVFEPGSTLTAVNRDADHMEVFGIDKTDGHVYNAWWDGNWHDDWNGHIGGSADIFERKASIAAISTRKGHMEVYALGKDGRLYSAYWWNGTWGGFTRVSARLFPKNSPVSAISCAEEFMDIMIVDKDGTPKVVNWKEGRTPYYQEPTTLRQSVTPTNPAAKTVPLTPIALCSKGLNELNAFCIGTDGKIAYAYTKHYAYNEWFDFEPL